MKRLFVSLALLLALTGSAAADQSLAAKLESRHIGEIRPGTYQAGEDLVFSLAHWEGKYLLRLDEDPEIYVLYPASTTMGGRLLKYDTGATAITVAGWGSMTIYTDTRPGGLPAMRAEENEPALPAQPSATFADVERAAADESAHLQYMRAVKVDFVADWGRLAQRPASWAQAFETIANTGRGIEQFAATPEGRRAVLRYLDAVRLQDGMRPAIAISGKTLLVTFDASKSYAGRASSRAVQHALGHMLTQKR